MRLFVAVRFSEETKAALLDAIRKLRESGEGNFTRPENLHLTLAFIGETTRVREASEALARIRAKPFEFKTRGSGRFGSIVWAGIAENEELTQLAESVRRGLGAAELPFDSKPFVPHITLAREYHARSVIVIPETTTRVTRVSLMKSERIDGRLKYSEVFGKDLA